MKNHDDRCRTLLLSERAALLTYNDGSPATTSEIGETRDEDWGPFSHERFVSVQVQTLDSQKLKMIDLALERLDSGEYGLCTDCEKPISPKRLRAIPWASRCVACQERFAETEHSYTETAA
jgi:DnaK suppressor protein